MRATLLILWIIGALLPRPQEHKLNGKHAPTPSVVIEQVVHCNDIMYREVLTQTPEYYTDAVKIPYNKKIAFPPDDTWWAACESVCGYDDEGNEKECVIMDN